MGEVCDDNHANMAGQGLLNPRLITFLGNGKGFQSATYRSLVLTPRVRDYTAKAVGSNRIIKGGGENTESPGMVHPNRRTLILNPSLTRTHPQTPAMWSWPLYLYSIYVYAYRRQ